MNKREKMFSMIQGAIMKLKKVGFSEDAATDAVLDGLNSMPAASVTDLDLLPLILEAIVELEMDLRSEILN